MLILVGVLATVLFVALCVSVFLGVGASIDREYYKGLSQIHKKYGESVHQQFEEFLETSSKNHKDLVVASDNYIAAINKAHALEVNKLNDTLLYIRSRIMAFEPATRAENPVLYKWFGELKAVINAVVKEK